MITGFLWRRRWDSNPRYREVQLISSQVVKTELGGIWRKITADERTSKMPCFQGLYDLVLLSHNNPLLWWLRFFRPQLDRAYGERRVFQNSLRCNRHPQTPVCFQSRFLLRIFQGSFFGWQCCRCRPAAYSLGTVGSTEQLFFGLTVSCLPPRFQPNRLRAAENFRNLNILSIGWKVQTIF